MQGKVEGREKKGETRGKGPEERNKREERGKRKEEEEGGRGKEGRIQKQTKEEGERKNEEIFCWEGTALGTLVNCSGHIRSVSLAQL